MKRKNEKIKTFLLIIGFDQSITKDWENSHNDSFFCFLKSGISIFKFKKDHIMNKRIKKPEIWI